MSKRALVPFLLVAMAAPSAAAAPGASPAERWMPWGPGHGTIQALALERETVPLRVCLAQQLGGIFCRSDGNATWQANNAGLDGANVVALAADPVGGDWWAV